LGLPRTTQVDAAQERLNPDHGSYRQAMRSLTTLMDRWVALNLYNALIANNVSYFSAKTVKLREWGPTSEYANRKRYHTVKCFLPAYAPPCIDTFGGAFSNLVLGKRMIRESTLAEAVRDIVLYAVDSAR